MTSLVALALATMTSSVPRSTPPGIPAIPFEKYTLPNGLQVILHVDHATPIVGTNVWYHVGSKNERPGRTGFAHLFEHMMFQGSKHFDHGYFAPLQQAGGQLNGSTAQDRTNYWETVPSNYLELALWMESDRMGFLLPAMTQAKLDNQRSVVKNERRQSFENRPYGLVYETYLAALYPPDHPYSWPTIGSMVDLDKASREDVAAFFGRYYHPSSASLCIAGDFDPDQARRLVAKYFGPLPAGPKVEKLPPRPIELHQEKRITMIDRVGLPRIYLVWPTVRMLADDEPALTVLADVLADGKTSRLEKVLVRKRQIAQDVRAEQDSEEIAGLLAIQATARPGHTTAELEAAILDEVRRLQQSPPGADEIARAVNRRQSRLIHSLESIGGFGGRADQLNMYNVMAGDPGYLAKDFARYLQVTPEQVQQAAHKYLTAGRVVVEVLKGSHRQTTPDTLAAAEKAREKLAEALHDEPLPAAEKAPEDHDRQTLPRPGPAPRFAVPPVRRTRLSNGMELLVIEKHLLPTVALNLVLREGRSADPRQKSGLTSLLTSVWDEGTARRTADQIADELAGIGASLSITAGWDTSTARLFTLKQHLHQALDVYADVLRNPTFPEHELIRDKSKALARLVQLRDDPMVLSQLATAALLYGPEHPYGRSPYGTRASLASIGRGDLEAAYRLRVRPEEATLIAVGDVTSEELVPALETALGGWKAAGGPAPATLPRPPAEEPTRIVLVDKPGAAQSVIAVSRIGAERHSPDYYSLTVMNSIFGGQFSSRLNLNLREAKGYTYGARSMFEWRIPQRGPFLATASVHTAVTAPALAEFLKEFQGMAGERAVTADELAFSQAWLTRGYPAEFETPDLLARQWETVVEHRLPDDYFNTYIPRISQVTAADVLRVARQFLDPGHLTIVVVADRSKVEAGLRELPLGKSLEVRQADEDLALVPGR
jgi:zinc protease